MRYLGIFLFGLLIVGCQSQPTVIRQEVGTQDFKDRVLVDSRSAFEYAGYHIAGSVRLNTGDFLILKNPKTEKRILDPDLNQIVERLAKRGISPLKQIVLLGSSVTDTEVLKWDPRLAAKGQRPRWSAVNNSHMFEWVLACAGDAKSYSPFEIGARITEVGMLGVLALRMQKTIVWDAEKRQAVGMPEADAIIDPPRSTDQFAPL